jgi:hypothetical protein
MLIAASVVLILIALGLPLFLTSRSIPEPEPVSPFDHLEDKKATIYESLRDLQAEFRMDKLSDSDYERTKQDLQRELALVMAEIEAISRGETAPETVEPDDPREDTRHAQAG